MSATRTTTTTVTTTTKVTPPVTLTTPALPSVPKASDFPRSLYRSPFIDLGDIKEDLFTADYVHNTFATLKLRGNTSKEGSWNYRAKVNLSKKMETSFLDDLKV